MYMKRYLITVEVTDVFIFHLLEYHMMGYAYVHVRGFVVKGLVTHYILATLSNKSTHKPLDGFSLTIDTG